ncbi:hypothetical protein SUDANB95_08010 (plasmid) [Actinosynnema sp. ALI-1.44]
MTLPVRTAEQRSRALDKANAVRRARSAVLAEVKDGITTVAAVLDRAARDKSDTIVGRIPVQRLLRAQRGWGKARAAGLMQRLGILPTRRASGLSERQRRALLTALRN